jgi:hypothetical protein
MSLRIIHVAASNGRVTIHTNDGTYTALAHSTEDLHRLAADQDHEAAGHAYRALIYRAAADLWERPS